MTMKQHIVPAGIALFGITGMCLAHGWYGIPIALGCIAAGFPIGIGIARLQEHLRPKPVTHWRWWAADVRTRPEDHIYPATITDWVTTMPVSEARRHLPSCFSVMDGRTVFHLEGRPDGHSRVQLSQFTQHETRVLLAHSYEEP